MTTKKKPIRNIGVITSGGDAGGLNAVIKGVGREAFAQGVKAFIIPNGYAGLYNLVNMEKIAELDADRVSRITASVAGSEAGHSRVKVSKIDDPEAYQRIRDGLAKFNIDALVISGGDDTGSVVVDLSRQGFPCIHAPKTMDLDLQTYSVGGDSAVNRISTMVRDLKTTAMSHNRILIVEVFGRYVGHTALLGGVGAEADCILIPEIPVDFDTVYENIKQTYFGRIERSDVKAGAYMMVVAEGICDANGQMIYDESVAPDAFGHKKLGGAGRYVKKQIENRLKSDPEVRKFMEGVGMYVPGIYEIPVVREIVPSHLVRSGETSAYDVNFGYRAGAAAVLLLLRGESGKTVVKVEGRRIHIMPTEKAILRREVNLDEVCLFESLGTCFGRDPELFDCEILEERRAGV